MISETKPVPVALTEQQARELAGAHAGTMSRIACGYLVEGPLVMAHLRTAMETVISQHSALRTVVVSKEGVEMQLVLPQAESPLFEVPGPPPEVSVMGMVKFIEEHIGKDRIRINHAPMWWVAVVRLAPTSHVLVGVCSRLVMDFTSLAVMFRSLLSTYLLQGRVAQPTPRAQYLSFSLAQDEWRKHERQDWVDRWMQRVDFDRVVSSRGMFPGRAAPGRPAATDMFELPPETMVLARRCAQQHRCELVQVLVAALCRAEREVMGVDEHRFVMSHPGREASEDRAIGAYQLNGLIALGSTEDDDLKALLDKTVAAWAFMGRNRGIGLESLLESLIERRGGPVPIPFRVSIHVGEPPPPPELPANSTLRIDFLPNLAERVAPLDPHAEGSVMFVLGGQRDSVMLSWWEAGSNAAYFENLWDTYTRTLARMLGANAPS
jgi:hypothetical protein